MDGGIVLTNANLTPHIACAPEDFANSNPGWTAAQEASANAPQ